MKKDIEKIKKEKYQPPVLIEYGTINILTQYQVGGGVDGAYPDPSDIDGSRLTG